MEERKEGLEKIKIKIDTAEGELKKNIREGEFLRVFEGLGDLEKKRKKEKIEV